MTTKRCAAGLQRGLALAALVVCWSVLPCGVASANEYHAFSCEDPYNGQGAPADDWRYDLVTNGYGDGAGSSCSGGGGSISAWMDGAVTHGFGEGGAATFTAPNGETISAFTLWRYEAAGPSVPYASPADNIAYDPGNVSIEGLCAEPDDCASRGSPQDRLSSTNEVGASGLAGVTSIQASAVCGGGPGGPYPCQESNVENGNSAEVDIYAADIVLDDPTIPTVTNLSGPLVSGGTLSGSPTVSFDASDSGPGVYSGTISVDGTPAAQQILDSNGGACQSLNVTKDGLRSFNHPQPCKSQVSATMSLNTTDLPPGTHSVLITVDDASGNSTTAWDGTITTTDANIPNGSPPCRPAVLSLAVNRKGSRAVIRYGHRASIQGTLLCGTAPIADAAIAFSGGGLDGTVVTDQGGGFTYTVPTGPSRRITFSYRAYSDDPALAARASAQISVLPRIRLAISPRRTHDGGTISWHGRITGGPYPSDGVTLLVEVKDGRRWQPFDEVVAHKGRFRYRYTFLRTSSPTTYKFRVALPASGSAGYEYRSSGSNEVSVYVR
jgi:hypothetical protein